MKKKKKYWLIIIPIAAIAIVAAVIFLPRLLGDASAPIASGTSAAASYTIGRGDVDVTITGSGTLEADDTVDISLPTGVKVDTIFVKTGDIVSAGDVLATLDTASLQYRAAELSSELTELDDDMGSRKTKTKITTPVSGRIKYMPAAADDDVIEAVNQYGSLAILSTDSMMQISLITASSLPLNAEVNVKWNGGTETGKVASKIAGGYLITLDDKNAPYLGSADIYYDGSKIGSGTLDIHAPLAIFGNGGTIDDVEYSLNSKVDSGSTLFTLDNEPATDSYRQTLADRAEKAAQLQTILSYQNSPSVVASVDATIHAINITEGKKTADGTNDDAEEMTAFTLGTGGAVKMSVAVDELDINNVAVGQQAIITLDAFSTETFPATVTRISHIGEPSGSITTYQTDLELNYDARLMDGMNGSAVITAESAHDVLIVPLGAIHEDANGSFVYVSGIGGVQSSVYIETGLSDGTNAEVISGLNEGDRIVYSASSGTSATAMFGAMGGGMSGGMPFGRNGQ